jgi:hypothetical protein
MCYGENGMVKFFETLANNVFRHNYTSLEIITCKTVETAKKRECPEDHLGIKNRIKKIPVN